MPELHAPIELQGIDLHGLQRLLDSRQLPPIERWNPPHCGHSGMRIAADGTWLHDGEPIRRPAMVRLFSSILRREPDGTHVLVTPVEKLSIDIERTAFRAVDMQVEGDGELRRIAFALDHGDPVLLGADHPLVVRDGVGGLSPRIKVRHGLEAELSRPVYYELAELALADGSDGVWSEGIFFPLDPDR
ncbi:DUF1285 domain-containing protein [Sphingomonas piscis]|uniref:DUF1285 domain-containing protein n=1 Tax=Sphingomonas piscis TaxID=2714943 RepID=A0A6G7YRY3_9SPHN|nr:DUF1285 domain-containing protein [Sphingomonas piscis]QIK79494.1 DUF1285 domain-containing protein [Sphingomonas piscis]